MAAQEAVAAIFEAVEDDDVEGVMRMLDEDARLLSTLRYGNTLLIRAAEGRGNVVVFQLLLDRGAEVDLATASGRTALFCAAQSGSEERVAILLRSGADLSRRTNHGMTPLHVASECGHEAVVRVLLRHMQGRWLDQRDDFGYTALWIACTNGHAEVVRALLLAGADHTIANRECRTPLRMAKQYRRGRLECVDMIQWWEGELQRGYVLHKARTLHEYTATHLHAPAAPLPALLRPRAERGNKPMPRQIVQGWDCSGVQMTRGVTKRTLEGRGVDVEKERDAVVEFVMKDLAAELYTELMAGFYG